MKKTVNVGIIGVGIVGERFLKALQRHGKANVVGIFDTNLERAELIAEQYDVLIYNTYADLLIDKDIDLIYLAVPPKYHHPIAMEIIKANKHIICEKPLANSIEEAREMFETAERANIVHAMNFPTVYTAGFHELKKLLDEGFLGTLRRVELHAYFEQWPRSWQQTDWIASREQGGFVREVFTHFVQMTQMLFGKITDVQTKIEYPEDSTLCETGVIATGVLPDGTPMLFNGFSNIGTKEELALTIYGTEGTLSFTNWRDLWKSTRGVEKMKVELGENDHLVDLIDEVLKAIEQKDARIVSFEQGYYAQMIIEQILDRV